MKKLVGHEKKGINEWMIATLAGSRVLNRTGARGILGRYLGSLKEVERVEYRGLVVTRTQLFRLIETNTDNPERGI